MAQVGNENRPDALPNPEIVRKERNVLSSSKIPVLSRSRLPPELKTSQQQQTCASNGRSKAIKNPKVLQADSLPSAGGLEPAAVLLPKSLSREPLGEIQLSSSGHRNESSRSDGKSTDHNGRGGVSTVEFVPDVAALASILSNTGLTSHVMSATHKPSLAGRVPLRGNRACSASIGAAQHSLYTNIPQGNLACFSCISRSTLKDTDHPQSCGLALNTQQLKTLSASLNNLGSKVEAGKPSLPTEDLRVGKSEDPATGSNTDGLNRMTQAGATAQSSSTGTKEATKSSWKDEKFVPDPAAKASILSNEGLSRFALGANGKLSLAQRVPLKGSRKTPVTCSSTRGDSGFFLERHRRLLSAGKFGRVPCSTPGLKGLKKSEVSGAQLTNTPCNRFSAVDSSPYPLTGRVPITCPQSLSRGPWPLNYVPLTSCHKNRRVNMKHQTETEQEKIATRLFDDEIPASTKKVLVVPAITPEMGKLQRIELLAQFLQQELKSGGVDKDIALSLGELYKLLSAHYSSALEPAKPDHLSTPSQDPGPNLHEPTPLCTVAVAPEPNAAPVTTSNQPPSYPSSFVPLAQPLSSSVSSSDRVKQLQDDLLFAPQHLHEVCLNEECAFYTAHTLSASPPSVQRCKEPVAKMLDAHDIMHFIPISVPVSPLGKGERPSSS